MRRPVVMYTPATYLDAPAPGEHVDGAICCVACGVVQPVVDVRLIHSCVSPSCPAVTWVELAPCVVS